MIVGFFVSESFCTNTIPFKPLKCIITRGCRVPEPPRQSTQTSPGPQRLELQACFLDDQWPTSRVSPVFEYAQPFRKVTIVFLSYQNLIRRCRLFISRFWWRRKDEYVGKFPQHSTPLVAAKNDSKDWILSAQVIHTATWCIRVTRTIVIQWKY